MSIKVTIALEFGREQHRDEFLHGLRALLLRQTSTPKYKVAVKMEFGNEELGEQLPLHLPSLGVADDSTTPLEQAIEEASRSGVGMRIIRKDEPTVTLSTPRREVVLTAQTAQNAAQALRSLHDEGKA